LYYLDEPIKVLFRYTDYLTEKGKILISIWDYKERNNKLWSLIDKNFNVINDVYLRNNHHNSAWYIKVIQK